MRYMGLQMGSKQEDWTKARGSDTTRHGHPAGAPHSTHPRLAPLIAQPCSAEKWVRCLALALTLYLSAPVAGLAQSAPPRDLIKTNLEDLMNMEVPSVSEKDQKLS